MEELENMNIDEIMDREEVKRVFQEMEKTLEDCKREE